MADTKELQRNENGYTLTPFRQSNLWNPESFLTASPWQLMRQMQADMDRMWQQIQQSSQSGGASTLSSILSPSVDVLEELRHWKIEVELPGIKPDDIDVEVANNQLTIRAKTERQQEGGDKRYQYR